MRALSLMLLLPGLALAQTGLIVQPASPPRGVTLPPTSAALVDEATALSVNPAGLRFVGPAQLFYLHERNLVRDQLGDGVYLGTTLGGLGAGVSMEWMRGRGLPDYRKTSFGLALGSRRLSLGVGYHTLSSRDASLDRLSGFDLGLTVRPTRFLSVAAVVKDVNAPMEGPFTLPRRYNLAVGVRPFGERVTLGADYLASEGAWDEGRLTYTVQAAVVPGFGLGAGLSHGLGGDRTLALQLAATLDSSRFGLTYAGGGAEGGGMDHVVAVRLSSQKYPALDFGGGTVAMLDLDDELRERGGTLSLLGFSEPDPYLRLARWMDEATKDPRLKGVVLKVSGLPGVDWGKAEELHQAVLRMRAAGKKVLTVLYSVNDLEYFVGSAADEVYALPSSSLLINGLAVHVVSLGGTMEKLGVTWDVARVGEYKTAPEQLTRSDMSPAQRETVEAYLDNQMAHDVAAVTKARRITPERLREAWGAGILTATRARDFGLVDGVLLPEELEDKLKKLMPGAAYDPTYSPKDERERRWTGRRRIAVVPVVGTISGGKSRKPPLVGGEAIAGAETVALALERAQRDPKVAAIVLRVDSGGGDILASELMYRAVLEAKKHKPVIASMGDVAASGGYYAAMAADEIWASPTTLTGSIGVFYFKPALRGLLGDKLGVNQETISRSPMADVLDSWRPWTEAEQKAVQAWVDSAYDDFITQVSVERKLDKARVDAIARGRVWAGSAAKERGLVDGLGGLVDAVEAARKRAGVPTGEELDLVVEGEAHGLFSSLGGEPGVDAEALPELNLGPVVQPALPPGVQALVREAGLDGAWVLEPGLKAVQPYTLRVR